MKSKADDRRKKAYYFPPFRYHRVEWYNSSSPLGGRRLFYDVRIGPSHPSTYHRTGLSLLPFPETEQNSCTTIQSCGARGWLMAICSFAIAYGLAPVFLKASVTHLLLLLLLLGALLIDCLSLGIANDCRVVLFITKMGD